MNELAYKISNAEWSELSNIDLRLKIIDVIREQAGYQTIAVGLDTNSKTVVIAGNIKTIQFLDPLLETTDPNKMSRKTAKKITRRVRITDVGFRREDYSIIQDIVSQAYPCHNVIVVQPSAKDFKKLVKENKGIVNNNKMIPNYKNPAVIAETLAFRQQGQTFHAEMQLKTYFKKHGDFSLNNKHIVASKPYCKKCREDLPDDVIDEFIEVGYGRDKMRWERLEDVEIISELRDNPALVRTRQAIFYSVPVIHELEGSGGRGSDFQDFTQQYIGKMTEAIDNHQDVLVELFAGLSETFEMLIGDHGRLNASPEHQSGPAS